MYRMRKEITQIRMEQGEAAAVEGQRDNGHGGHTAPSGTDRQFPTGQAQGVSPEGYITDGLAGAPSYASTHHVGIVHSRGG